MVSDLQGALCEREAAGDPCAPVAAKLEAIHFGKANMIEESRGLLTPEAAESLAAEFFAWMAGEPEVLSRFMAASGLDPATIRAAASDPSFLGGVLDFAVGDDAVVVAFARHAGIPSDRVGAAWTTLSMKPPPRRPTR